MNPADLKAKLAAYADGELSPGERAVVEARLADEPGLRAEVQRWQALRQATRRAVMLEPVPAGLAGRLTADLHALRRVRRPRIMRLGLSGLAAAAMLMFAVVLWPTRNAGATTLAASFLSERHWSNACGAAVDTLGVRGDHPTAEYDARDDVTPDFECVSQHASFPCKVPCLMKFGYKLRGATEYRRDDGTCIIHAHYLCKQAEQVMSMFVINRPLHLQAERSQSRPCCQTKKRRYHVAQCEKTTMISWTEGQRTYVLCCGKANSDELAKLADQLTIEQPAAKPCNGRP